MKEILKKSLHSIWFIKNWKKIILWINKKFLIKVILNYKKIKVNLVWILLFIIWIKKNYWINLIKKILLINNKTHSKFKNSKFVKKLPKLNLKI